MTEHIEAEQRNREVVSKIQRDLKTPEDIVMLMAERDKLTKELKERDKARKNLRPPFCQKVIFETVWYGCIFAVFWFFVGRFLPTIFKYAYLHFKG